MFPSFISSFFFYFSFQTTNYLKNECSLNRTNVRKIKQDRFESSKTHI